MSAILCGYKIVCADGIDFPISNYTSEGPEQVQQFHSVLFPESWVKQGCLSLCVSNVSQAAADLCALTQAAACNPPPICVGSTCSGGNGGGGGGNEGGGGDGGGGGANVFYNTAQDCSVNCPDGSPFTSTIPAGTFSASTQAAADARANAYACELSRASLLCIGDLTNDGACAGTAYTGIVGILSVRGVFNVEVISGDLPVGFSLTFNNQSFTISGNTANPGQYDFRVKVDDVIGNSDEKDFTLYVIEITQDSLPNGTVGAAYSQTLTSTGPVEGVVTWAVISGALPDGLTLNTATGAITGSPTTAGTYSFIISMTDQR